VDKGYQIQITNIEKPNILVFVRLYLSVLEPFSHILFHCPFVAALRIKCATFPRRMHNWGPLKPEDRQKTILLLLS
jgi:hypothetical protein